MIMAHRHNGRPMVAWPASSPSSLAPSARRYVRQRRFTLGGYSSRWLALHPGRLRQERQRWRKGRKICILISSGLAVGALRTHNQSANSTTANSSSRPYSPSDNGAGRLTTSVPLFCQSILILDFKSLPQKRDEKKSVF